MKNLARTYTPKKENLVPRWFVVDAEGKTLGRLASRIALVLMGKHKPTYAPHLLTGDFVIVTNARKVKLTGKKLLQKKYYRYSGYIGGMKVKTAGELLKTKPEELIRHAVSGMLPKNRLRKRMLKRLKIYAGPEHPHQAQKPEVLNV